MPFRIPLLAFQNTVGPLEKFYMEHEDDVHAKVIGFTGGSIGRFVCPACSARAFAFAVQDLNSG